MALQDQINTVFSGADALIGSGRLGTPIDPENIRHIIALSAGTVITDTLTRSLLRSLQRQGKAVMLNDAFDVAWANEDNQISTAPNSGTKSKTRDGLYELTMQFKNGIHFQKVLRSMEGQGRWDIILVDDNGVKWGNSNTNSDFRGFRTSMFAVTPYAFKSGGEGGLTSVNIQLARSIELNQQVAFIRPEQSGFDPADVDGVNQVRLDLKTASGTEIVVKAVLDKDNYTFAGGLTAANFLVKVNGATVEGVTVTENAADKTYKLTVPALTAEQKVEVKLYNSADNTSVVSVGEDPEDILYQSQSAITVVAA